MGRGFKEVTDKRAGAGGPIVNEAGEPISAIPRKTVTQEQILDKIAAHFKEKLERVEITTVGEYVELLKKEIEWADNLFRDSVEKFPDSGLEVLEKRKLTQLIAERAELLFIAETLETRGLQKICEDLVSRVKDAKNISKEGYESFLNRFISGEEPIEVIIRDAQLSQGERRGVNALLEQGENKDILELGRQFNAVKGFNYPTSGIRAWAWKKAEQVAKANLADLLGGATWAAKILTTDSSAKLGEEIAKQYEKKHAKFTRKVSMLNIGKVAVAAAVVLGAGYLLSQCSSCIFGTGGKEGGRPSVKKKRRDPVSPTEIELYKNPLFRSKDKTHTPKFVVIAKHLALVLKLQDEEQVKVAKILNKLPGQFIRGMDLRESIELAVILRALSPKVSSQKIAETVVAIQQHVDPQQTKQFAQQLAKKAGNAAGIAAFFETPPRGIKMTDEWYNRVFPAFLEAGFSERDKFLPVLCGTIRRARVSKGKEGGYALTIAEQNNLATSLAEIYGSSRRPKIPTTYHEDVEFILQMRAKGFKVTTAASVMSSLRFVYDPEHLDSASSLVLKNIKPGMGEYQMRLAIEAPAFEKRGWASKAWKSAPDPRLLELFTSERDASKFSSELRALPQTAYEDAIGTLGTFANKWQAEVETLTSKKIAETMPQVIALARSKAFAHLSPDKKAQILFQLVSKLKAPTRKTDPRAAALRHLESKFKGQKPTLSTVLAELAAYLGPEKAADAGV